MREQTYHFIGIGGAGMSALARVLHSRGVHVTGSDMVASPTLEALSRELGEALHVGHSAENIASPNLVVASAAIKETNPEMIEARRRGIPVIYRAELLGRVMDLYSVRIAVSGTHGKTTTSAMAAQMLMRAGLDPTALVGADVPAWKSNTQIGASDRIVAESCEAYGSFLELRPTHSIITNIEADHLDFYGNFDAVLEAFAQFVRQTSEKVIVCTDGGADRLVAAFAEGKLLTYGLGSGDVSGTMESDGRVYVRYLDTPLGSFTVNAPGRHNALNALSVVALGLTLDIPFKAIAEGLADFRGTSRRFELLGELPGGITLIDDYAHHPTEIRATLAAAKLKYPNRRIIALFQPHLPSRTRDLMDEFAASFGDADLVLITDIYLAREAAMPGVTAEFLTERVAIERGQSAVRYTGDLAQSAKSLADIMRPDDLILTLGAGSVRWAGESLLRERPLTAAS